MQKFKSHRVVEAAQIVGIDRNAVTGGAVLRFGERDTDSVAVSGEWVHRFKPEVGGFYLQYPDGYTSWSPAQAFEEGYTPLVHDPKDGALPVSGYKPQTEASVAVVNGNKAAEEATLRILDMLESFPGIDRRWLAIGRTDIEKGWMAVNRAVFKPGRAKLPGDPE